nr:hypothetical protein [uncultured Butyrivibrio sp.]
MRKKISDYLFTYIFIALLFGLSIASFVKLFNFYVNDEKEYNEWKPSLGSKFETDMANNFWGKFSFVNLNGAVRKMLNQYSMNGVIKLENGYLLTTVEKCSDETLGEYADKTIRLNEYLKNRGTAFVYAATPYTSSKYDPELPVGVVDYGNDNVDRFIDMLKAGGVDTIDYRQVIHDDGLDQYDMMYVTDHHWTTRTGLYAYGFLEDFIKEKCSCDVDDRIRDINNYTVTNYEKWHLGSRGQRTGIYYAGIDDFELIVPEFETKLQNDEGTVGTMQDLMLDMSPLENKNFTSRYTYDSVQWQTLGHYTNLNCPNDIKVLIVTDSFGRALGQYLAMAFKEVDYIYNIDDEKLTPEYIEAFDPDVVIMLNYSENLIENSKSFSFDEF